jgi:RimJ/RimL family protein N-acetyltransferase
MIILPAGAAVHWFLAGAERISMNIQPITLEGRVARLEPLAARHAESLAEVATPELFTYTFPPRELSPAGFREGIARVCSLSGFCPFAIVLREHGRAIGMTSYLDIRPQDLGVEIGFTWIAKPHQHSAVNPECKYMLFRHAFDDQGAARVQLKTDLRNLQSQRAIEKLGAVREGVLRKHMMLPDGFIRDTVMYSVTADEWPAVRARLEERLGYVP